MNAECPQIFCCRLDAIDADALARCRDLLNDEERQRLALFRSEAAAKQFVVGRALLRSCLALRLYCAPRALRFAPAVDGKPQLLTPESHWQFNLSHSGDWIVLALCEGAAVGVDVESYARHNNLHAIAQRFFSEAENTGLARCVGDEWLDHFFAVWTLKEAHAKALGCGLAKILSCSSIAIDLRARTIGLKLRAAAYTPHRVSSWLYHLDKSSALALVAHGDTGSVPRIHRWTPLHAAELFDVEICAQGI